MIPVNKLFPWKDLVGKTIKDVERGENHTAGFGAMDGLVCQCGEGFDAKADYESFQAQQ